MPALMPANGRFTLTVNLGGTLIPGPPGKGVPPGGAAGQVLAKASGDDYDTEWRTLPSGGGGGGSGTVTSVNAVLPDAFGNVQLAPEDVGAMDEDEELTILEVIEMWNNA